ncbi:tRNA dihydrouridine(20/20a) synthase DusA [Hydrocarboniphaga sp.]|uniref:tRNA dihydrouridine(20/20a) synthase DusA n=1 Tax=Hydrocarboniphaga sp. TaxID=2033016 RepID=UPI00260E9BD6|nr:tRNA dihydrouridine(20/20a) synthase DusA [Hydrocarboniphaga sp.]
MTAFATTSIAPPARRLCIAPMMDWSDTHCRSFHRLLAPHALLYTEMVTTGALLHGDVARHLRFDAGEHPLALQLGGSEPDALARCAEMAEAWNYDEVNLNCGCPSDRVQEGSFGACLMREPERVAASVAAMRRATSLPVTVKHRIGVDDCEDYAFMRHFVESVAAAGCTVFIVHARKAWLQGLSPRENREIPPLTYEHVYRLKQDYPQLTIVINGGIRSLADCETHLAQVDGVMLGREAYENPYALAAIDAALFAVIGGTPASMPTRDAVLAAYRPYVERQLAAGTPLKHISRHLLGLYRGQAGGRQFRRTLSERAHQPGAGIDVLMNAMPRAQDMLNVVDERAAA